MESLILTTDDGQQLVVRCFASPAGMVAQRVVLIGSALGVPQTFYERYARWLSGHGCHVYTIDWRGMGLSAPAELKGYRVKLIDWGLKDAAALMALATSRHPDLPVTWFGHSMGGILYGVMPQLPQVDQVVTLGAGSGYTRHLARPLRYGMFFFWNVLVPLSVAKHGYFAGKRFNVVGDLPRGVVGQWRRWCLSPRFIASEGDDIHQAYGRVTKSITSILFSDDKMAFSAGVSYMHSLYTQAPITMLKLRPQDVGVSRVGHFDFFHKRNGPVAWAHSLKWLGVTSTPIAEV